jgi:hypothetical protein
VRNGARGVADCPTSIRCREAMSDLIPADDLLARTLRTYAALESYSDHGELTSRIESSDRTQPRQTRRTRFATRWKHPKSLRFDFREMTVGPEDEWTKYVIWSRADIARTWWTVQPTVEVARDLNEALAGAAGISGRLSMFIPNLLRGRASAAGMPIAPDGFVGEEVLLDGVRCLCIGMQCRDGDEQLWIEAESALDSASLDSFGYWVSELLDHLDASGTVDAARIARLEWAFLPLLDKPPRFLHQELSRDPVFFVEMLSLVWRGASEEATDGTPEQVERATRASSLLHSWRRLPGSDAAGSIDDGALRVWVKTAREQLAAKARKDIGDLRLGEALSSAPAGADGIWPLEVVRDILEECDSDDIEHGMVSGLLNSRGFRSQSMTNAGEAERRQADLYRKHAASVAARWPRTAIVLMELARRYVAEAQWDAQDAELRDVLYP